VQISIFWLWVSFLGNGQVPDKLILPDAQAARYRAIYNALKALCPYRLTTTEMLALRKAVRHQVLCERVEIDPNARLKDVVRCGNMARRSLQDWQQMAKARNAAQRQAAPSLALLELAR
jgi:hypothetical protein